MPKEETFREYGDERDPHYGPEPPGYHSPRCGVRRFVVQKHAGGGFTMISGSRRTGAEVMGGAKGPS